MAQNLEKHGSGARLTEQKETRRNRIAIHKWRVIPMPELTGPTGGGPWQARAN